jgi:Fic family protein
MRGNLIENVHQKYPKANLMKPGETRTVAKILYGGYQLKYSFDEIVRITKLPEKEVKKEIKELLKKGDIRQFGEEYKWTRKK